MFINIKMPNAILGPHNVFVGNLARLVLLNGALLHLEVKKCLHFNSLGAKLRKQADRRPYMGVHGIAKPDNLNFPWAALLLCKNTLKSRKKLI